MFFQLLYEAGPSDEKESIEALIWLPHACNVSATYHHRPQRERMYQEAGLQWEDAFMSPTPHSVLSFGASLNNSL